MSVPPNLQIAASRLPSPFAKQMPDTSWRILRGKWQRMASSGSGTANFLSCEAFSSRHSSGINTATQERSGKDALDSPPMQCHSISLRFKNGQRISDTSPLPSDDAPDHSGPDEIHLLVAWHGLTLCGWAQILKRSDSFWIYDAACLRTCSLFMSFCCSLQGSSMQITMDQHVWQPSKWSMCSCERQRRKADGSAGFGLVLKNVQHPVIEVAMVPW